MSSNKKSIPDLVSFKGIPNGSFPNLGSSPTEHQQVFRPENQWEGRQKEAMTAMGDGVINAVASFGPPFFDSNM